MRPDGQWSCLPVENLTDGKHQLTPVAVDAAGNRTPGQPVTLVVDTVAPDRPVLTTPAPGETLRVSRPKLAGRAEPGSNVLVTVRAGAGSDPDRRTVLCGATTALDENWTCTANRDLANGEQWLVVTATDLAGNGTSADPVRVRVAAPAVTQTPTVSDPRGAVGAVTGGPSPANVAEAAEPEEGEARPPAAPPVEAAPSGRSEEAGWRGGLAGVLLVLTGIGLITRRVFARGPGARRR